ncbi:magnesium transporter CorA [Streptomyces carminius]|uniref:Magnesium transporter CorA n=1 Tax=Streptomyces carminius TaxID=2665496 RepID=A0A2M8LSJ6_9ACTN|nr:magnesium and cobalt transport protein CorA [Streptomyces carminius]PJE94927.1 magnesium transporter CorA [Streptomyces carminius]
MADVIVDRAVYRDGHRTEDSGDLPGAAEAARSTAGAFVWVGLADPGEEELAAVAEAFGLHPLAVEDALSARQRPKLETYDGSLFLVLRPVAYDEAAGTVRTGELMLFVGDSFVVTVRHGVIDPLGEVRERLEREPEVLRHGPAAVLYAVSDAVVDRYLDVAALLRTDLDELEERVLAPAPAAAGGRGSAVAREIYAFKRQVLEFRRAAGPAVEPMERLAGAGVPFVPDRSRPFFRDVGDHLIRVNDQTEAMDRLLSDILSAYLTQVSVRQNDDMRRISAWAAMAAAPTMITGVYGMNFTHLPELSRPWGYPVVLVLIAGVCTGLYRTFRRRGWL